MKRLVCFLSVLCLALGVSAQTVTTPNVGLQLPAAGSTNWNLPLNYNFNLLDQLFGGLLTSGNKLAYRPLLTLGGPSAACNANNKGQLDFDTTTTPWSQYVCDGTSTWHASGGGGSGGGATFPSTPGIVWNTSTLGSRNATLSDLINGFWAGCSGLLKSDGTCASTSGGVSSVIPGSNVTCSPLVSGSCTGNVVINATPSSTASVPLPLSKYNVGLSMLHITDSTGPGGVYVYNGPPVNGTGAFPQCPGTSNQAWGQVFVEIDVTPYKFFNCSPENNVWTEGLPFGSATERIFAAYNQQSPHPLFSNDYPYPGTYYSNSSGAINTGNSACLDVFNTELFPWATRNDSSNPTYFNECGIGDWLNWSHAIGWGSITDGPTLIGGTVTAAMMFEGSSKYGFTPAQSSSLGTTGTWTALNPTVVTGPATFTNGSTAGNLPSGTTPTHPDQYWRVVDLTNPGAFPTGTYLTSWSNTTGQPVTFSNPATLTSTSGSPDNLQFTDYSSLPYIPGYAKCATGSGNTMTFNSLPSPAVYISYIIDGSSPGSATATAAIDGGTPIAISNGDGNSFGTVHYNKAWWGKRLQGSSTAPHQVVISVTSGTFCMLGFSTPGNFNGLEMPRVVQELLPPNSTAYNPGFDQALRDSVANVVSQMKTDGYNVEAADFFLNWPESQGATGFYEHNAGTYGNGLGSTYAASPHFNDFGNRVNGDAQLRAAKQIPYSAPDVKTGPCSTLNFTPTQSTDYVDVSTNGLSNTTYATSTNVGDVYSVSLPCVSTLTNGLRVRFLPSADNTTTTPTIKINGGSAIPIVVFGVNNPKAHDLKSTAVAELIYLSGNFQLQVPQTLGNSTTGGGSFQGAWSGTSPYNQGDSVSYNGTVYFAKSAVTAPSGTPVLTAFSQNGSSTSATITVGGGDTVLFYQAYNACANTTPPTDTGGNTWSLVAGQISTAADGTIWGTTALASGSITITACSGAGNGVQAEDWTGLTLTVNTSANGAWNAFTETNPVTVSISPTVTTELVMFFQDGTGPTPYSAIGGLSLDSQTTAGAFGNAVLGHVFKNSGTYTLGLQTPGGGVTRGDMVIAALVPNNLNPNPSVDTGHWQVSYTPTSIFNFSVLQESYGNSGSSNVSTYTYTFPLPLQSSGATAWMVVAADGSAAVGTPSGWTVDVNQAAGSFARFMILHKTSAGDTSAAFTMSSSSIAVSFFELSGARTLDASSIGTSANATYTALPAITPTSGSMVFGAGASCSPGSGIVATVPAPLIGPWQSLQTNSISSGGRWLNLESYTVPGAGVSVKPPALNWSAQSQFSGCGIAYGSFSIK